MKQVNVCEDADRLIERKTVSFALAEPYDFIPSLLGNMNRALSENPSLQSDSNWWSTTWCSLVDHLRTHYSKKSVSENGALL